MKMTGFKTKSNSGLRSAAAATMIFALGSTIANTTLAEHYHWKNERGESVYSDRPPTAGQDYEVVSRWSSSPPNDESDIVIEDSANDSPEAKAAAKLDKDTNCKRAKMNLISLESADVVNVKDAQGVARQMSSEERQIATETAKAQIKVYCQE
jgi:hypothetical protein